LLLVFVLTHQGQHDGHVRLAHGHLGVSSVGEGEGGFLVPKEPPCGAYWRCCWSFGLSLALWPVSSATTTAGRTRTVPTLGPLRSRSLASHLNYVGLNAKIAHCSVPQPSK